MNRCSVLLILVIYALGQRTKVSNHRDSRLIFVILSPRHGSFIERLWWKSNSEGMRYCLILCTYKEINRCKYICIYNA